MIYFLRTLQFVNCSTPTLQLPVTHEQSMRSHNTCVRCGYETEAGRLTQEPPLMLMYDSNRYDALFLCILYGVEF